MNRFYGLGGLALAALTAVMAPAFGHGVVGQRFFPATLATDDPAVAEELSLPTASFSKPDGDTREIDLATEYSKRLTRHLGVSFGETWSHAHVAGAGNASGFQNLETSLKYQFLTDAPSETILSAGVEVEWGGSGAARAGAENVTTVAPSFYFGKGAGDLPDGLAFARPFALTGVVSYAVPVRDHDGPDLAPQTLEFGGALEYSLPYLAAHVRDLGLPRWVNQLTPLVEASFERPLVHGGGERTTGTIDPGILWAGRYLQLGAEANFPINRGTAKTVGFTVQLHFFVDDLFPHSLGAPIFGGDAR